MSSVAEEPTETKAKKPGLAPKTWRRYITFMFVIVGIITAVRSAMPSNETVVTVTGLAETLLIVTHLVALVYGILRNRPEAFKSWMFITLAPALVLVAVVADTMHREINGQDSYPAAADWLFLAALMPTLVFMGIANHRRSAGDRAGLLDASMIAIAFAFLTWTFLVSPHVGSNELSTAAKVCLFSLPVLDVVTAWLITRMVLSREDRTPVVNSMIVADVILLVSDCAFTWMTLNHHTTPLAYGLCSSGWDVAYVLFFATALHPDMTKLIRPATVRPQLGGRKRLTAIFTAALLGPIVIAYQATNGNGQGLAGAIATIAMFCLVVWRMEGMLRRQEETTRELDDSLRKLTAADIHLRHAQKLEAVGKLAAGVAHEINTPIQFIQSNVGFLKSSFETIQPLADVHEQMLPQYSDEIRQLVEPMVDRADLEFLRSNVPLAIDETLEGADRVATIVKAMREFGAPASDRPKSIDINNAIGNVIAVAGSQLHGVDVITDFGNMPLVNCYPADVNQILLNLVVNAALAVEDKSPSAAGPREIQISTWRDDENAYMSVRDTGVGINSEILPRIYEPFFTTRPVGSGTGQGLAIVWNLVVDRHDGSIDVQTEVGSGTTFTVRLPLSVNREISVDDAAGKSVA